MAVSQPRDRYVRINGLRLHYLEWKGDGPAVLLLHGLTSHAHIWDDVSSFFHHRGFHIIALDQRGHGDSEWAADASYTLDDHLADLTGFIERLDLTGLTLMGHSMGGRNALFYTACHPEAVARLILVDARPGNSVQASATLQEHLATLPLSASCLDDVGRAIGVLYPRLPWDVIVGIARRGYRRGRGGMLVPKFDTRMAAHLERSRYAAEDLWPFLPNISCPTLVVRGEESPFLSRRDARRMCRLMDRAELCEIPGATHMPAHENAAAFHEAVSAFLHK